MPLYEYKCESCGRTFSILHLSRSRGDSPKCPVCGGAEVKKMLSSFACSIGGGGYGSSGHFGSGSGSA